MQGEFGPVGSDKEVGTGLTLQTRLNEKRILTFNAAIARDASLQEHNELVDKLTAVCDRQEMRYLLEDLERNLVVDEDGLKAAHEAFVSVDENCERQWKARGKKGEPRLSDSEMAAKKQCGVNIERFKHEIGNKKAAIAELKRKLGNGASSATDSGAGDSDR